MNADDRKIIKKAIEELSKALGPLEETEGY